jgi:hypothetical protein
MSLAGLAIPELMPCLLVAGSKISEVLRNRTQKGVAELTVIFLAQNLFIHDSN